MKIRFFGSSDCQDCLNVFVIIEKFQIDYEYYDGHDVDNDEVYNMCEEQNVEDLPHLQFLDDNNIIIKEHIGAITEQVFSLYMEVYFPNIEKIL